jgi:hypothetical protein
MHLKNISVIKTLDTDTGEILVEMSPAYDAMTTTIYTELSDTKSALRYKPEQDLNETFGLAVDFPMEPELKYIENRDDLLSIAKQSGIDPTLAIDIISEISEAIASNAVSIANNPPDLIKAHPVCLHALKCAVTDILAKSDSSIIPEWTPVYREDFKPAMPLSPPRPF